jgi:uncharacterized protein (DUF2062 family)
MTETVPVAPAPARTFWQRWLLDPVRRQLTQGVSPGKIALSIAVGSALALFPILGTTTTLCLLAGIFLGLNQPILQAVNAVCLPIYLPGVVAFIRLGDWLTGSSTASLNVPVMFALASHHPGEFLRQFGATAAHAVLGWAAVAPFWIVGVFLILRPILRAAAHRLPARV